VTSWSLVALAGLGAAHGLNPAMGWLFSVWIGLQEGSRRALLTSLVPIAIGHELSIGVTVLIVEVSAGAVSQQAVGLAGAALLVGFGVWKLRATRAHPRWVGLRLSHRELAGWSFLMSTAHGAGLMLLPLALRSGQPATHDLADLGGIGLGAFAAAGVHTLAMVLVMGTVAVAVYELVGLRFLRSRWINLDRVWALGLISAGVVSFFVA
jgi:hypothetical protein